MSILKTIRKFFPILLLLFSITTVTPVKAADDNVLFFDDFSDNNLNDWNINSGDWTINNGNLTTTTTGSLNFLGEINTGSSQWDNYRVELDINQVNGIDNGIEFRRTPGNAYTFNLRHGTGAFDTPEIKFFRTVGGVSTLVNSVHNQSLLNNVWYHLKIEVFNENIKLWVNDNLVFNYSDSGTQIKKGGIGLQSWSGTIGSVQIRFDNIKITSLNPTPFLDLPFDYEKSGLSFNDASQIINSFFDHEYPLLSSGASEPSNNLGTIINYLGPPRADKPYSSHDGYDYGKKAGVNIGDSVLAAAAGWATYVNSCGACGNMILIDHQNGYQTRYLHLQKDGLIISTPGQKVWAENRQPIGKVGATGNVFPSGDAGAHIHFGVVQDKNNDGNFEDNIPDGMTDPFGWQSADLDPWPNYSFSYSGKQRTGNTSYYLWKKQLDNLDATLTSNGGVFSSGRYSVNIMPQTTSQNLNLQIKSRPNAKISDSIVSLGSTIDMSARDAFGNLITTYPKFFTILVNFGILDLSRFKTSTLSFYSSSDGLHWTKEPTSVDLNSQTAATSVNHMTYFALAAERADTIAPKTEATLSGLSGQPNWFRSDVTLNLNAEDNEGGLGVDYIMYKKDSADWQQYNNPLTITEEGHHKINFYSADNDENLEEVKSIEFDIDKTSPTANVDANPKELWPPNGKLVEVTVTGNSFDEHLYTTKITVLDEYGLIKPVINSFGQTVALQAQRKGSDADGRRYTIKAVVEDLAGNATEKITEVIVPHDQDKKL